MYSHLNRGEGTAHQVPDALENRQVRGVQEGGVLQGLWKRYHGGNGLILQILARKDTSDTTSWIEVCVDYESIDRERVMGDRHYPMGRSCQGA